jgi:hypothetical protein
MHASFGFGMHQEPETKRPSNIRDGQVFRGDLFSGLIAPRIERLPAQGTVVSPNPVAGPD